MSLCVFLPKIIGFAKIFDNSRTMSFWPKMKNYLKKIKKI